MKKLTTIFGALLFSFLIITSCGSDKNDKSNKSDKTTTTPKKTPLQVEAEEAGDKICEMMEIRQSMMNLEAEAMKMIENGEADGWDDPIFQEMEQEFLELEDKFDELDVAAESMILDKEFDNSETAEKYISYFKNSVEKCRDAIEEYTGWEDMIGDIEYSILSQFDTPQTINTDNQEGWSEVDQNEFIQECNSDPEMDLSDYCDCFLGIMMSMYDSPEEAEEYMTEDEVAEAADACSYTFDM